MRGVARLGGGPPFPPSSSSPDPLPPLPYLMTFSAAIWGKTGWKKALKTKAAGAADGEERTKKCKILISGENRLCCRRHCLFSFSSQKWSILLLLPLSTTHSGKNVFTRLGDPRPMQVANSPNLEKAFVSDSLQYSGATWLRCPSANRE